MWKVFYQWCDSKLQPFCKKQCNRIIKSGGWRKSVSVSISLQLSSPYTRYYSTRGRGKSSASSALLSNKNDGQNGMVEACPHRVVCGYLCKYHICLEITFTIKKCYVFYWFSFLIKTPNLAKLKFIIHKYCFRGFSLNMPFSYKLFWLITQKIFV